MSNNSWTKFERPLCLDLRPSRLLLRSYGGLHLLLLLAWSRAPVSTVVLALVAVSALISWVYHYRYVIALTAPTAVDRVSWDRQRGWRLHSVRQRWYAAELIGSAYVTRHLVVARFRTGGRISRRVLVVADRVDRDDFRRLRVRLLQSADGCGD